MTHRHIEAVDLTKDDDLSEEDHCAAQLTALDEGSAVLKDELANEQSTAAIAAPVAPP